MAKKNRIETEEKEPKKNLYLLAIVAIVAVVGIVVMILNAGTGNFYSSGNDLTGEALRLGRSAEAGCLNVNRPCTGTWTYDSTTGTCTCVVSGVSGTVGATDAAADSESCPQLCCVYRSGTCVRWSACYGGC